MRWRKGPKSLDSCRSGLAVFVSWFLLSSQAVCAAAITVEGDAPLKSIAVTIEGATLNNVVLDLSQKYGFEVKGVEMLNNAYTLSARMSGSLRSVLEKLLQHCNYCNYMILPSPDNKSGVERVVILKSTHGPATWQRLQPNADASIDIPSESSSPIGPLFGLGH
jgi:hypothetical protein